MSTSGKGYTSTRLGLFSRINESWTLFLGYRKGRAGFVKHAIELMNGVFEEVSGVLGKPVKGLDILDVGSGQQSIQLAIMSEDNRAIGIDQESSGEGLSLKRLFEMARNDGVMRAVKTVGRKALGFDRESREEYAKQSGRGHWPKLTIMKMNAEQMSFPDNSFDVIFSHAVFEHVSNPAGVLKEVARVLRPGGVFYCMYHLYTSDSGCHDVRIFVDRRENLPYWSHLRDSQRSKVVENTYLNKLSLEEWRRIFESNLPGSQVIPMMDDASPERIAEIARIRATGELTEYTDEELLSVTVKVIWKR